ncbi:conserved hypothetical protein [Methanolacinia petrolearia DSM 11571]|uniref:Integral membrane protein n=1 Tax=Methanolacinia petrolearia (strain DSM 11571 / OCM 486 / SEBR 4847) TaxID=679926 RepID=E1RJ69_METP4|nr:DUF6790 family protein [Methanolacinia petrolearia]ADN35587.1 conserved hypothetical protein [Methanolacinia petrolearia DSM 11571]
MKISIWAMMLILSVLVAIISLLLTGTMNIHNVVYAFLFWLLVIGVGVTGIIAFSGHFFKADGIAEKIGWPKGNPFQREIAFTNLGIGIAGVLCFFLKDGFWLAVIVMYSIFSAGAGFGHIYEQRKNENAAEYNTGAVVAFDILMPVVLIALWILMSVT